VTATNGSQPGSRPRGVVLSRRVRLLIGISAAVVIATVLVAPIVLLTGSSGTKPCAQVLRYSRNAYTARPIAAGAVEGIAIGIGVINGCGATPSNINIRSLHGVKPSVAVGLAADESSIYVRRGVCTRATPPGLLGCVSASP
jgi:hypothetical protein